ncbi:MAG: prolyl oligopeptidase family serine peptidase [Phycisphaerales bacterium]
MASRFDTLPTSLKKQARPTRLAGVPSLLVHPDWERPAPFVLWMHGRTVDKELDPGRYLRWMRAGIGACAIDLPGHGERHEAAADEPSSSLRVMKQALGEVDAVLDALHAAHPRLFDAARAGIGGMSLGGMATLRRLCEPHGFSCAAVESTTGWLGELYNPTLPEPPGRIPPHRHADAEVAPLDPMGHLDGFEPLPLLVLHSEADRMVPWAGQAAFVAALRKRYEARGADPAMIEVMTWPETGAPSEHAGFGKVAGEAKDAQTAFLRRGFGVE